MSRARTARAHATPRYRRSPNVVSYWDDTRLVFHNFATGRRIGGTALTIGLLDYFDTWKPRPLSWNDRAFRGPSCATL